MFVTNTGLQQSLPPSLSYSMTESIVVNLYFRYLYCEELCAEESLPSQGGVSPTAIATAASVQIWSVKS